MKTLSVFAVLAFAGSAMALDTLAIDRSTLLLSNGAFSIQATPLDDASPVMRTSVLYSHMDGPYSAFAAASGPGGFDDYVSTAGNDIILEEFRFVGGVTAAGGVLFFDFFDNAQNFVDGFGLQLPQAGNFIWTITLNVPIIVPNAGIVQAFFNNDPGIGPVTSGQWFLSDSATTVGSDSRTFGGAAGGAFQHSFELSGTVIPAPGALALMGLAGLAAT
ncbi:MAG: hypothetical protein EA380_00590, partial [Phycisphaeraceae bacterium]